MRTESIATLPSPAGGRRLDDLPPVDRIRRALARAGGNGTRAARLLVWSRRTFCRTLAGHGHGGRAADAGV